MKLMQFHLPYCKDLTSLLTDNLTGLTEGDDNSIPSE